MADDRRHVRGLVLSTVSWTDSPIAVAAALTLAVALGPLADPVRAEGQPEVSAPEETSADGLWSRSTLTGSWRGVRDTLAEHGLGVDLDATYTFQGVADGGFDGPVFDRVSDENDTGHTFSGNLKLEIDAGKAGLWQGGFVNARLEARVGRSVLQRAGTVSAVNNDALFPNVVDRFDDEAFAVTELTFRQYIGERVALFGGLLNTAEGDENELAGSALSNAHFLNSAILYSLVEDATVPNTSLGGGVLVEPIENVAGSFSVFGTEETAGEDPFAHTEGTTFSTEWTFGYALRTGPGAQTLGLLYGIDASRTDIAADPRLVIGGLLAGEPVSTTTDDTWALYYNGHQYLHGDAEGGFGLFARFGVSDGDPNPVRWNVAGGFGGKGLVPRRVEDTWGLGGFYLGLSDEDLLAGLDVGDEIGGEIFYSLAVTPWLHVTVDAQVIDSALRRADTTWVLGVRTHVRM